MISPEKNSEGYFDRQIPGFTQESVPFSAIFPAFIPREGTTPEGISSALSAFSSDKPDTVKCFFDLFDSIPSEKLKELKNEGDTNPFGDIYALMRRRTKKLLENGDTATTLSRQLTPIIYGKETGIAPETKMQFFKVAVASLGIDSEDEGVQEAALDALVRLDPSILTGPKPEAGAEKHSKQDIFNSIFEKALGYIPPKRVVQIASIGLAASLLAACVGEAPIAGAKNISGKNQMFPTAEVISDTETAVWLSTVQTKQPVKSPTLLEIATATPKSTETRQPIPTKTEIFPTPTEKVSWTEKYLFTEDEIPKGAVNLDKIYPTEWQKYEITGPGQVFYQCGIQKVIEQNEKEKKYLSGFDLNLTQAKFKYCGFASLTDKYIKKSYSQLLPKPSPEELQALIERKLMLSQAFTKAIPKDHIIYLDAYYVFFLNAYDNMDDIMDKDIGYDIAINWRVYGKTYLDSKEKLNPLPIEVLDVLPVFTPNP